MPERQRIPQPPGPHPPIVRPPFTLKCQYCREPNRGQGKRHQRVSDDPTRSVTYYRCWNCEDPQSGRPSVFKVIRASETQRSDREAT